MNVIFAKPAKLELDDAVAYYELEHSGLGIKFKEEVQKNIERIKKFPQAASIERGEIRKSLLHKFPYKILYSIESDHIFIIALAHQHRKPDYWVDRKSDE
jgi:plasmid stabilization system protein ParE